MAVFALYVEKETSYFGAVRVFGNTYHYTTAVGVPFDDEGAALQVVAAERAITEESVTFTRWQTWGPTDGQQIDNVMREAGELSGTGDAPSLSGRYVESCVLVVWPLPRSPVTNRRRWLRKFGRLWTDPVGGFVDAQAAGRAPLDESEKDAIISQYAVPVLEVQGTDGATLSTSDGTTTNGDPVVRPYLFTRQIGA